jgi:hypothetical protein
MSSTRLYSPRCSPDGTSVWATPCSPAQGIYADSGAFPELLSICHLFGDPAMRIR